jgi:hypothetical protein
MASPLLLFNRVWKEIGKESTWISTKIIILGISNFIHNAGLAMIKTIGIGCFHFGIKKKIPFTFLGKEYIQNLESCLKKLNNISNISMKVEDSFLEFTEEIKEELPKLDSSYGYYPFLEPYSAIEFEIFLPYRIQAQLYGIEEKLLDTYTEKFFVSINYSFYFPIVIVEPIKPTKISDASKAVSILWKFFKKEINTELEKHIIFEILGPSPFHIEIVIQPVIPDDEDDWHFNPELKIGYGYDKYVINYNNSLIKDSSEAFEYLKYKIIDEFGLYYKFEQLKIEQMHNWSDIYEQIDILRGAIKYKWFRKIYFRLLERGRLINILTNKLIDFESKAIFNNNDRNREFKELYRQEDNLFKQVIEKDYYDDYEYPVNQAKELLCFIEGRRIKNIEIIIALISAIIGGVIGAILTGS